MEGQFGIQGGYIFKNMVVEQCWQKHGINFWTLSDIYTLMQAAI